MAIAHNEAAIETRSEPVVVSRYRYIVFVVLALCYVMSTFHRIAGAAIAGDLTSTFSIDAASLGLLTALYFYPYAFVQIPVGMMADRLGARLTISIFITIAGVGALLFGLAPSFGWVLVGRALVGAGVGVVYVPAVRTISMWFRRYETATFIGLLMASGQAGSLIATQPLAAFTQAFSWRSAFVGIGGLSLVVAVVNYIFVRNRPQQIGLPALIIERNSHAVPLGQALLTVLCNRTWRLLAVAFFCYGGASLSFQGLWAGPYLTDVYGLSKVTAGGILAAMPLGMLVAFPLAGRLSDRVFRSRHKSVVFGVLLLATTWFALTFGNRVIPSQLMYLILFAFGVGNGFYMVATTQVMELFPIEIAGTAGGAYNMVCFLGAGIFQQGLGMILKTYPLVGGAFPPQAYRSAFSVCLVAMVVASACILSIKDRPNR
jgi:sugar phosphate permease